MHKKWIALCRRKIMLFVLAGPFLWFSLLACQRLTSAKADKISYIVIAVDGLTVNDVNCYKETRPGIKSGFDTLCQESIRYTHSYSTSNLSLPALTSILTYKYPFQHGVRDNSMSLKASVQTVQELAYSKGFRTSFFSGGPSILRRSGLQQGFEFFDDNFTPNSKRLYRPAQQTLHEAQAWIKENLKENFFAVIYLADIFFKDSETVNDLGEVRSSSADSQIEEVDESLYHFFQSIMKSGRWDQTEIILVGLNGRKEGAVHPFDQKSVYLQVATLIKPAQKPRDQGISWSIDPSISGIDIGYTLARQIDPSIELKKDSWQPLDLSESLKKAHLKTPKRWILSESAWPQWRATKIPGNGVFFSFRQDPYMIAATHRLRVYNTLIDKTESLSIPWKDFSDKDGMSEVQHDLDLFSWTSGPSVTLENNFISERSISLEQMQPCLDLLKSKNKDNTKICDDNLSSSFIDWLQLEKSNQTDQADWLKKKLIRATYYTWIDRKIAKANSQLNWIWDTSAATLIPVTTGEYILQMPEYTKERQWLMKEISAVKEN